MFKKGKKKLSGKMAVKREE